MPADSDHQISLPHTWKPFGVRIAVWLFGGGLLIVCAAVWILLGPEIRSWFSTYQRVTTVFLFLLLLACYWGLLRSRITATETGLTVINGYRTHEYEWAQVLGISMGRGAPWAQLDLSDGETRMVLGIQGSDGERALQAVREIRALISAPPTPKP